MAEALFNASGLGLPIVMTVANRAIGAPINIWNDHSDSMSQRDCGWIQLYAEDNQAAVELHVLAFRLAETLSRAGDGLRRRVRADPRVRTHRGAGPGRSSTRYLPPYRAAPGPRPGRAGDHRRDGRPGGVHRGALPRPPPAAARRGRLRTIWPPSYAAADRSTGCRPSSRTGSSGARTVVLDARLGGRHRARTPSTSCAEPVGVVSLTLFRPFPAEELRAALAGAEHVIVLERAFAPGARRRRVRRRPRRARGPADHASARWSPAWAAAPVTKASVRAMLARRGCRPAAGPAASSTCDRCRRLAVGRRTAAAPLRSPHRRMHVMTART